MPQDIFKTVRWESDNDKDGMIQMLERCDNYRIFLSPLTRELMIYMGKHQGEKQQRPN